MLMCRPRLILPRMGHLVGKRNRVTSMTLFVWMMMNERNGESGLIRICVCMCVITFKVIFLTEWVLHIDKFFMCVYFCASNFCVKLSIDVCDVRKIKKLSN